MSAARPIVVLADPIDPGAKATLASGPCELRDASGDPSRLAGELASAWGLVVRSRTKVTRELLSQAPRLSVIARAGVGVDNIDMAAAAERDIRVVNAPTAASTSVAELTVLFALLLVRRALPTIVATRGGTWDRSAKGGEIAGRTFGFVGYGRIAREVAKRLGPFGVRTVAYDPFVPKAVDSTEIVGLEAVLEGSELVRVHAALSKENYHLLGERAFARMKPGAFLINVARGPLVDEKALLAALRSGHLGGAALDVYEVEPPLDRELVDDPNVIATPHIGASTIEGQARAGAMVAEEILRALKGEPLTSLVAPAGATR